MAAHRGSLYAQVSPPPYIHFPALSPFWCLRLKGSKLWVIYPWGTQLCLSLKAPREGIQNLHGAPTHKAVSSVVGSLRPTSWKAAKSGIELQPHALQSSLLPYPILSPAVPGATPCPLYKGAWPSQQYFPHLDQSHANPACKYHFCDQNCVSSIAPTSASLHLLLSLVGKDFSMVQWQNLQPADRIIDSTHTYKHIYLTASWPE